MKTLSISLLLAATMTLSAFQADAQRSSRRAKAAEPAPTEAAADVDYKTAPINVVADAAREGNLDAMCAMGHKYYNGDGVAQNPETAAKWWSKAAREGHPESTAWLGVCFLQGKGVSENADQAFKLFDKALGLKYAPILDTLDSVAATNPDVAIYLAKKYAPRTGALKAVKPNREKQEKYLTMAADAGNVDGMRELGLFYMNTRNYDKAVTAFERGAKADDNVSRYYLGRLYSESNFGQTLNPTQALINMRAAADGGNREACRYMGVWYDNGTNVTADTREAQRYYQKAAAAGSDKARWTLGIHHAKGDGYDLDYNIALNWFTSTDPAVYTKTFKTLFADTAIILKNTNFGEFVQALKSMSGPTPDYADAKNRFKKLEKAKNLQATTYLAICDYENPAVKFDEKKLVKALQKAAKKGDPYAKYRLAEYYAKQSKYDRDEIITLLNEAAQAGLGQAYSLLGELSCEGRVISVSYPAAAEAFEQAYILGGLSTHAASLYADILANGRGDVPADAAKAETLRKYDPDKQRAAFLAAVPTAVK